MQIQQLYEQYKVMPTLQTHMHRVAAVAFQIINSVDLDLDQTSLITACLLHDIGNIVKFKLGLYPDALEPEGLEYWQGVQNEIKNKYGESENEATRNILREIGLSREVLEIVDSIGFSKALQVKESSSFEKKIACYSDQRVAFYKIVSIRGRIEDGKERFLKNKNINPEEFEKYDKERILFGNALLEIENQIFQHSKIKPEDITDDSISMYIDKSKSFNIPKV
jgi:hypothetical protein